MKNRLEVTSREAAWQLVDALFPEGCQKDVVESEWMGRPVYCSKSNPRDRHIYDHGSSLRVDLDDIDRAIDIWIVRDVSYNGIIVKAVATDTGDIRHYESYARFRADFRFWLGGPIDEYETQFEQIITALRIVSALEDRDIEFETAVGGLKISFSTSDQEREAISDITAWGKGFGEGKRAAYEAALEVINELDDGVITMWQARDTLRECFNMALSEE